MSAAADIENDTAAQLKSPSALCTSSRRSAAGMINIGAVPWSSTDSATSPADRLRSASISVQAALASRTPVPIGLIGTSQPTRHRDRVQDHGGPDAAETEHEQGRILARVRRAAVVGGRDDRERRCAGADAAKRGDQHDGRELREECGRLVVRETQRADIDEQDVQSGKGELRRRDHGKLLAPLHAAFRRVPATAKATATTRTGNRTMRIRNALPKLLTVVPMPRSATANTSRP